MRFGIVISEWNSEITDGLHKGALETLEKHGARSSNIKSIHVPGSFELPLGAQFLAETKDFDAIITIGCVIQGQTKHFDYVCQGTTTGIKDVALKYNIPVIFCVLTDNNIEQSRARAGGEHGNKGVEAAVSAIKMVALKNTLTKTKIQ